MVVRCDGDDNGAGWIVSLFPILSLRWVNFKLIF